MTNFFGTKDTSTVKSMCFTDVFVTNPKRISYWFSLNRITNALILTALLN